MKRRGRARDHEEDPRVGAVDGLSSSQRGPTTTRPQIVEPFALGEFYVDPKNFDVAVAILSWLAEEVERELRETMGGAKLKVIRAEYEGAHPVIAIRYKDGHEGDLGPSVGATIAGIVERKT